MSLLNEMLHDLAKQKNAKQVIPLFIPTLAQNRHKSGKIFFLFSLAVLAITFYFCMVNKSADKIKIKKVATQNTPVNPNRQPEHSEEFPVVQEMSHGARHDVVLPTEMMPEPVNEGSLLLPPPMPVSLPSYVEPLTSSASQRILLQSQDNPAELLNTSMENQAEPSASVNKVYAPVSLEEWRNEQLNKALQAIDTGFDDQAITILQEIIVKIPNAIDARENLASLYLAYNDFSHAAEVVNEGLKYSPADTALITMKARIFLDQGKAADAIKLLSKHRPSIMSYPDFYATLAAALQSQGRILEAGSIYRSLIQIDSNDGRYWLGYAIALEHNQKINQAVEAYTRASQDPDSDPTVRDYAENRLRSLQG